MEPVAHYCRYYRVTPYKGISHHSLINNKPPLSWATLSVFETGFIISLFSSGREPAQTKMQKELLLKLEKIHMFYSFQNFLYSIWVDLLCLSRFLLSHLSIFLLTFMRTLPP